MAFLTSIGVISQSDTFAVESIHGDVIGCLLPLAMISISQISLQGVLVTCLMSGTYLLSALRSSLIEFIDDVDEDNSTGIRSLIAWGEDGWVAIAAFMLIIMPIVVLLLVAVGSLGLWLFQKHLEKLEEKRKVQCKECSNGIYATARYCPMCNSENDAVRRIGLLGQTLQEPAQDTGQQKLQLASLRRCPRCASRLKKRGTYQQCGSCGCTVSSEVDFENEYIPFVKARISRCLVICGLLSAIPILGLIPGIIYYRISLIRPFRAYIAAGSSFLTKWLVRIAGFLIIGLLGWVPLISTLTVPLLALIGYTGYHRAFRKQLVLDKSREDRGEKPLLNKSRDTDSRAKAIRKSHI